MTFSFEDTLCQSSQHLFEGIDRVLLAVSGGADSVAMAHALVSLRKKGRLSCDFVIGHINHCLRGADSDEDERFVKELAESLGVPVVTTRVDVSACAEEKKLSIETAGRKLRIQALGQMAEEYDCQGIATAHHADDQAETMIHRLMRGAGYRGLCGIKPESSVCGWIYARPMLGVRRGEIVEYCKANSICWREDASNTNLAFTRNRIRHQLLPSLQGKTDLVELLGMLAIAAQNLQQRVDTVLEKVIKNSTLGDGLGGQICFSQAKLKNQSPWIFYEIIRNALVICGGGLRDYSKSHFDTIGEMWNRDKAKADFPGGIEVVVENGIVMIRQKEYIFPKIDLDDAVTLQPGETVDFSLWRITTRFLEADKEDVSQFFKTKDQYVEWFDADKVVGPIEIRSRKDGDRFWPIGASGEKKIARFLIDAQMNQAEKKRSFLIKDADKILWVAPVRMCDPAKVTRQTRKIIEIRILSRFV